MNNLLVNLLDRIPNRPLLEKNKVVYLGAVVTLLAIPATIVLLKTNRDNRIQAELAGQVVEDSVRVTNIHAHGFTVSWKTYGTSKGVIHWGPNGNELLQIAYDDRAQGNDTQKADYVVSTHYVTLPYPMGDTRTNELFATPSQSFDFKILSGNDKEYGGVFDGRFKVTDVVENANAVTVLTAVEIQQDDTKCDIDLTLKCPDINRDGTVNDPDVQKISENYGKPVISCPECDLDRDGDIDILDATYLGYNYGKPATDFPVCAANSGCPDPAYGEIKKSDGTPSSEAVVYMQLHDNGGQGSPGFSSYLSGFVSAEGKYVVELGNARTENLVESFAFDRDIDLEVITVEGGIDGDGFLRDNPTSNDTPIPIITLNHAPTLDPISDQAVVEGQKFQYNTTAIDLDGDELIYGLGCYVKGRGCTSNEPAGMTIDQAGVIHWDQPISQDQPYLIKVWVKDAAHGDSPAVQQFNLTVSLAPVNNEPDTFITAGPEEGNATNETSVNFEFDGADDNTPAENLLFAWKVDSGPWSEFSDSKTAALINLVEGGHIFSVKAKDEAGLEDITPAQRTFAVDQHGPTIKHTPVTESLINQPINVQATITDSTIIANAKIFYNNIANENSESEELTMQGAESSYQAQIPTTDVVEPWVRYYIIATDAAGNQSRSPNSGYYAVTVTRPLAALSRVAVTPGTASLDTQQTKEFTAQAYDSSNNPINGNVTYSWTISNNIGSLSTDHGLSTTFTAVNPGNGVLEVTATLADASAKNQAPIKVVSGLSCSDSHITPDNFYIAAGGTQTLTANITGGSGSYTYTWSATGGSFSWIRPGPVAGWIAPTNATNGQTYTITVAITDQETGTICPNQITTKATIGFPQISITPTGGTIETGKTKQFTAQAHQPNGQPINSGLTYTWNSHSDTLNKPVGAFSNTTGSSTTFTAGTDPATDGIVSVTAEYNGQSYTGETNVKIIAPLSCTNTKINPETFTVAPGESKGLDVVVEGGSGSYTYAWSATGGSFSWIRPGPNTAWIAPTDAQNGQTYTITVAVADQETETSCPTQVTARATVSVPQQIITKVLISPESKTLDVNQTQTFTATAYSNEEPIINGVTFAWTVGGNIGIISTQSGGSTTFTAKNPGTGSIDVSANLDDVTVYRSASVTVNDTIAPGTITDLKVSDPTTTSLKLAWTAPGDDGEAGTAASYDIRYSTESITDGNWDNGTTVKKASGAPIPTAAGSTQTYTLIGLNPNTNYYVAIKTIDERNNWSGLSNVVSGKTSEQAAAEYKLTINLKFEGRPGDSRGHAGTVDIFAKAKGQTAKVWHQENAAVSIAGSIEELSLTGLTPGDYEILLKGYEHLRAKKDLTISDDKPTYTLDFGTLTTGDVAGTSTEYTNRDNKVNSLDNDVLLQNWVATWNTPQVCNNSYKDCKITDFNLDSKVNSIDHDYTFRNWDKSGVD